MKVNLLFSVLIMSSIPLQTAQFSNVELNQLKQDRTTNLVIVNDIHESYQIFPNNVMFPWMEVTYQLSMTNELLSSLADNQLVLCSKTVWHNLQFYAQMWENFATKTEGELWEIYKNYTGFGTIDFLEKRKFLKQVARYVPIIKKYHEMYQALNKTIADHSHESVDEYADSLKDQFYSDITIVGDELDKDENIFIVNIEGLLQFYSCYQLILAHGYHCKAVNDSMILFIPKNLLNQTTQSHLFNSFNLGLYLFNLPDYPFKTPVAADTSLFTRISKAVKAGQDFLSLDHGKILVETLKKLAVSHQAMPHETVLPFFNFFMRGHGSTYKTSAAISTKLVGSTTDSSSTFLKFLDVLQYSYHTKSFALGTCFASGKNIKQMFEAEFPLRSRRLEKYSFPIIMLGTSITVTYGNAAPSSFLFEEKNIHPVQNLYAAAPAYYTSYFKALNVSDSPDYLQAINNIANIYRLDETSNILGLNKVSNYITIKFPHTEWFTPPTFKKFVINLPQIAMSTRTTDLLIHPDTKLILVSANKIFPTLQFTDQDLLTATLQSSDSDGSGDLSSEDESPSDSAEASPVSDQESCSGSSCDQVLLSGQENLYSLLGPIFMPVNYLNQNYVFDHLEFLNPVSLDFVMHKFFAVENIEEPINIVIKKLTINSWRIEGKEPIIYKDVCIFIFKKFDVFKEAQNGFMFTAPNNKVYMASWDHYEPFPDFPKKLSFEIARAKRMIEQVELQATQNLKSFENLEKMLQAKSVSESVIKHHESDWVKDPVTGKWISPFFPNKLGSVNKI